MTKSKPKLVLSNTRLIPFNKLVLSQANVRRVSNGVSIEDLAEDIAHRGLLHNLNVRPVLDDAGAETDMFEIPAGGRRYRALEILVKQKRLPKTAEIPCNVKSADDPISAEEDSLAENTFREALHPLDEFRAIQELSAKGLGDETIAAPAQDHAGGGEAAQAPGERVGEAARDLWRGRHDAGTAHGLHRQRRPCAAGACLGLHRGPNLRRGPL